MEMLLTGEMIDASTRADFGLVNRVVPREYLTQIVNKYAQTIASKSPSTLKIGKEAFYRQAEMGLAEAYDYASRVMVENMLAATPRKASAPSSASASRNGRASSGTAHLHRHHRR